MIAATTIRNFHATVLPLLGFNHERFTYRHLGLDFKLTGGGVGQGVVEVEIEHPGPPRRFEVGQEGAAHHLLPLEDRYQGLVGRVGAGAERLRPWEGAGPRGPRS